MKTATQKLFEIAETQQGFFTSKQAKASGFDERNHPYHVQSGNWIRESRGIYRLANFPVPERPDLVLWALWSRNRSGETEGVYSHETALSIYELSDLNPSKLHMTVPKHFRRMSETPKGVILHKAELEHSDIAQKEGYLMTRPLRAVIDLIEAGSIDEEFLRQVLNEGLNRGLITRTEMRERHLSQKVHEQLEQLLGEITYGKAAQVR